MWMSTYLLFQHLVGTSVYLISVTNAQCRAAVCRMAHPYIILGHLSFSLSLLQLIQKFPDLYFDLPLITPLAIYHWHLTIPIHSSLTRLFHVIEQHEAFSTYRNSSGRGSNQVSWFLQ